MKFRSYLLQFSILIFLPACVFTPAFGYEIVTALLKDCSSYSGFIVADSEDEISILNSSGELDHLAAKSIDQIVVHDVVDFPFTLDRLAEQTPWFEITLLDQDKSHFNGLPIQFVDQLAFFLNDSGRIEVISFSQLSSLREIAGSDKVVQWKGEKPDLDFSSIRGRCPKLPEGRILPTRVLSDPVQIVEYLRNYEQGFEKFSHLRERMNFYAKPVLYPYSTRFGLVSLGANPETPDQAAINFKFSSGLPYGLQSLTEILSIQNDAIPFYFPTNSANLEVKSHLFHAQLVAHIPSIAGGSSYFNNAFSAGNNFSSANGYYFPAGSTLVLSHSYNYLTQFGIDYKAWSFSIGGYYPIEYAYVNSNSREVLSASAQPAVLLSYTTESWKLRFSGSQFKQSQSTDGSNPTLIASDTNGSSLTQVQSASRGFFVRAGFDWDITKNFKMKLDAIDHQWSFNDNLGLSASTKETTLALGLSKDFGKYVSLHLYYAQIDYNWSANADGSAFNKVTHAGITGGEFEFIF